MLIFSCLSIICGAYAAKLRDDLLFRVSFDKNCNADFAKGSNKAIIYGKVELKNGKNGGKCAIFRKKGDYINYLSTGNYNPRRGTIIFYVKELDTKAKQRIWNSYFQLIDFKKRQIFEIVRLWQPFSVAGGIWQSCRVLEKVGAPVAAENKWAQYAFTWQRNVIAIYKNGKLEDKRYNVSFALPVEKGARFYLGRSKHASAWSDSFHTGTHLLKDAPAKAKEMKIGKEPYGAFAIDDLCIFKRDLSAKEIQLLAEKPLNTCLSMSAVDAPVLDISVSTSEQLILAFMDGVNPKKGNTAFIELLDKTGKVLQKRKVSFNESGSLPVTLDTSKLKLGTYKLSGRVYQGNKLTAESKVVDYNKTKPEEWLNNKYGLADVVLPGFEPLKANEKQVDLWGRTYVFSGQMLPVQIINQKEKILARPISWKAVINGKQYSLKTDSAELVSSGKTRAVYKCAGKLGPLKVNAKIMVEYDGFIKCDFAFVPNGKVLVEKLWMEIPLCPEQAKLFFFAERRRADWPKSWRAPLDIGKKAIITMGTPERCLQWMTETDQYYFPQDNPKALQIENKGKARIFKTVVIDAKKEIDKTIPLTFALEAGPVKARPANWRGWYMKGRRYDKPGLHNNINYKYTGWARSPGEPIPPNGFPKENNPEMYKGQINNVSMHFGGYRAFREKHDLNKRTPEWAKYESEWVRIPEKVHGATRPGWNSHTLDRNSCSWGQWHIYGVQKLFEKTGVRGLYYDDWLQSLVSTNKLAGSGYVDANGVRRPTQSIYAARENHRRVYAIIKALRPKDGIIIIHDSGMPVLPIHAFCDVVYDGEVMLWADRIPKDGNFFDTFRHDIVQTLFTGKQFGVIGALHDVSRLYSKKKSCGPKVLTMPKQRQLWALLLLHDIHCQGGFTSGMEELRYIWLDEFGIAEPDVKFHPYWKTPPAVKFEKAKMNGGPERASKFYASAYTRKNRALVVIARDAPNNYGSVAEAKFKIDRKKLNLPSGKLESWDMESLGRTPLGKVDGDILTVPVMPDDYAAVLIKPAVNK